MQQLFLYQVIYDVYSYGSEIYLKLKKTCFLIFLLVGLKEACIPNFSFLGMYFTTSPDGRADGRPGGQLEESKIRLTQPSLAETGAEIGNFRIIYGENKKGLQKTLSRLQL